MSTIVEKFTRPMQQPTLQVRHQQPTLQVRHQQPTLQARHQQSALQARHQQPTLQTRHQQQSRKKWLFVALLACVTLFFLLIDLITGPAELDLATVISVLLNREQADLYLQVIIWEVRLPYSLMAIVVGAALGLAGAEMQTALNNPLASPFTLGISAAATLGAAFVVVFNLQIWGIPPHYLLPTFAFGFSLLATAIILLVIRFINASISTIVLFGISLFFALNAAVSFLQFLSDDNALQQIVFWTMGSLSRADWQTVLVVACCLVVCFPLAMRNVAAMTLLRCGEEHAQASGVDVAKLRYGIMIRVSLLTAISICFVGEIGFIGLIGPHIARLLIGEDHRFFLPMSAISGALLMCLASIASKVIISGVVLPISIVTSIVGIPLFIILILSRSSRV